jgi:hypothetical protein
LQNWIAVFVLMVAVAALLQAALLAALLVSVRRTSVRMERLANELQAKVTPVLSAVHTLVEETQPHITNMAADAAEITHLARTQVQRVDRVMAEGLERLRLQLIHADQILGSALDTVEETGEKMRRGILGPVQSVVAVVQGIKTGIEVLRYRGNRRHPVEAPSDQPDDTLFI